jgi:hypothetical protein
MPAKNGPTRPSAIEHELRKVCPTGITRGIAITYNWRDKRAAERRHAREIDRQIKCRDKNNNQLCTRCALVDFNSVSVREGGFRLGNICESWMTSFCSLCQLFALKSTAFVEGQLASSCPYYYLKQASNDHLFVANIAFRYNTAKEILSTATTGFIKLSHSNPDAEREPPFIGLPSEKCDFNTISSWLKDCLCTHGDDCFTNTPVSCQIALIDCETSEIVSAQPEWHYVALSYV